MAQDDPDLLDSKCCSCLSFPSSWDYRPVPLPPAIFVLFKNELLSDKSLWGITVLMYLSKENVRF
jgi:hypothetical protein